MMTFKLSSRTIATFAFAVMALATVTLYWRPAQAANDPAQPCSAGSTCLYVLHESGPNGRSAIIGTTQSGGATASCGTIYALVYDGIAVTKRTYAFSGPDGCRPNPTVWSPTTSSPSIFGTTSFGGSVTGVCPGAVYPANLEGPTLGGGHPPSGCGTVFKFRPVDPANFLGAWTVDSYSFSGPDGAYPTDGLRFQIMTHSGVSEFWLLGSTLSGGANHCGAVASPAGCGTVFALTVDSSFVPLGLKALGFFQGGADGQYPGDISTTN